MCSGVWSESNGWMPHWCEKKYAHQTAPSRNAYTIFLGVNFFNWIFLQLSKQPNRITSNAFLFWIELMELHVWSSIIELLSWIAFPSVPRRRRKDIMIIIRLGRRFRCEVVAWTQIASHGQSQFVSVVRETSKVLHIFVSHHLERTAGPKCI